MQAQTIPLKTTREPFDPAYDPEHALSPGTGKDYAPTYWIGTAGPQPEDDGPITADIDVDVAARLAEVRVEDFKALNPSQRKPVIFAAGTPQILLPWNNADTFKQNLAKPAPGPLASRPAAWWSTKHPAAGSTATG